jgi:hypothetical protein
MMGVKGFRVVAVGVVIAAIILGVTWPHHPQATAQPPAAPAPAQIGRFKMASTNGHVYVLDTATGQVWEAFAGPNQGSTDKDFKDPKVKPQR